MSMQAVLAISRQAGTSGIASSTNLETVTDTCCWLLTSLLDIRRETAELGEMVIIEKSTKSIRFTSVNI